MRSMMHTIDTATASGPFFCAEARRTLLQVAACSYQRSIPRIGLLCGVFCGRVAALELLLLERAAGDGLREERSLFMREAFYNSSGGGDGAAAEE